MLRRFFLTGSVTLIVLLAVVLLGVWLLLRASLPAPQGKLSMPGLTAPVSLHYDAWERPFVSAQTRSDALQVQGWLHGTHRLWQMELLRRAGSGRLADLLGEDLAQADIAHWRAGVPELGQRLEANASVETLQQVDRYLLGVNAAIDQYRVLPPEFLLLRHTVSRWTRADVFAVGALVAWQSANNLSNELVRLALAGTLDAQHYAVFAREIPGGTDYPYVVPTGTDVAGILAASADLDSTDPAFNLAVPRLGFGSNGWVVSASRSTRGAPLYAFDSHDELGLPNLFYEVHLFFGDHGQLRGWSTPGLPGVINGYNAHIAWGFTNIGDTQDLFVEERHADNPLSFRDGDAWYLAASVTHSLPIAGAEPLSFEVVTTRNGPLIAQDPPVSLAWTATRAEQPTFDALLSLSTASDWPSFNAALDQLPAPTLNATYTDVHGTVGFRTAGLLPRRGRGDGRAPQRGADVAARWQGFVDADVMPRETAGAPGFLAAANARVAPPGAGPLVSADNAAPYRIARIQSVLSAGDDMSLQDMQALQMDREDGQARQLVPALVDAVDATALTPMAREALAAIEEWQSHPVAAPDSVAALVFQHWYIALAREVFAERVGDSWPSLLRRSYLLNQALDALILGDGRSVWWQGERPTRLANALNAAAASLQSQLGGEVQRWRLSAVQRVALQHPLGRQVSPLLSWLFDVPAQAWGGSPATVGRAGYRYDRPNEVSHAATVRVVGVMSAVPEFYAVMPGGQSGHPLSTHYADQYEGWLAGALYPIASRPAALGEAAWWFTPLAAATSAGP